MAAFLSPVALIGGLAVAGGGFDVTDRHIAGLAVWLVVVVLLVFGAASSAKLGRSFYWGAGLIAALALLCAISSFWSGSVELSVIEADRVLVYLGMFVAAFLVAQTDARRQRFAEGLAVTLAFIALLGLGSRLLPHVLHLESLGGGPRLRYPLGYSNADGEMFGIGVAMLLWASRRALMSWLRWAAVALMPALLLALYFTYSRGGLLALVIAAGATIALSRDRLWMLATLAIGALGAVPAVLAVQDRRGIAENLAEGATVDQGVTVLLVLLAGIALALLLFVALRWAESSGGSLTGRAVEASRNPTVLKVIAAAAAVLALAAAIAVGGRAWDQFSSSDIQFPNRAESHFSDLSSAGRKEFWRVALDTFREEPVHGIGAGTYQFAWEHHRSIEQPVHDAHSLYLESFAELGVIGGALVLALVGLLLWAGFAAWRAAPEPQRDLHAVLLAAMTAFAVGAAIDWFWELAAVGGVFFLCAGALVAARCAQLDRPQPGRRFEDRRWGFAAAGLAVAWISAIALIGPLLVEHELNASRSSAADGDLAEAVDHADRARSIEPWAASPYVQLGLLAELEGDYPGAISRFGEAIDREDQNWQWFYLRSKAEQGAGDEAAARSDLERARELNPLAKCLRTEAGCG
ncbi:MAG TPA: O-antigen ligase family protein [Solirubrobacterales bacterium]